jgi:hypothetical protein
MSLDQDVERLVGHDTFFNAPALTALRAAAASSNSACWGHGAVCGSPAEPLRPARCGKRATFGRKPI